LLSPRELREVEATLDHLKATIESRLSLDNPRFAADPEGYTEQFKNAIRTRIVSFMEEAKRRHEIVSAIQAGGRPTAPPGGSHPFLVKRLSQRALTGIVRYFRDVRVGGE